MAKTLGFDPIDAVKGIFGGGTRDCLTQQGEIEDAISQYLMPSDMRELVGLAYNHINPTPVDMAWFYVGGKDCKHKNVHPDDQRFLDALPRRIEQRARQQARQQQQVSHPVAHTPQPTQAGAGGNDMVKWGVLGAVAVVLITLVFK